MNKDKDPGKWGPAVAGTIEEGETYETNIYKEASEEIGLENVQFTSGPKILTHGSRRQWIQWYFVTLNRDIDSFKLQADEVDELVWIGVEDLMNDLESYPDKYIPSMQNIMSTIYK